MKDMAPLNSYADALFKAGLDIVTQPHRNFSHEP